MAIPFEFIPLHFGFIESRSAWACAPIADVALHGRSGLRAPVQQVVVDIFWSGASPGDDRTGGGSCVAPPHVIDVVLCDCSFHVASTRNVGFVLIVIINLNLFPWNGLSIAYFSLSNCGQSALFFLRFT